MSTHFPASPRIAAIVVGAGDGRRVGGPVPKTYRAIAGEAMLRWSVRAFADCPRVHHVIPVCAADRLDQARAALAGMDALPPVAGGGTRQASVLAGLIALVPSAPDIVLIHDAARPCVSEDVVNRVIDAIRPGRAVIPALPVTDTLRRVDGAVCGDTVDRARLVRAQTPQGFWYADILAAHREAQGAELTDDAAVAAHAGIAVDWVEGSENNIKVTTEADFARAERIIGTKPMIVRVGTGFDVHAFGAGDHVWLGGVRIDHARGLKGHSDADVVLHALTDALLGAIGDGDIGVHFPPTDPQWRGAASEIFLTHAAGLVSMRAGIIDAVDVTVIGERPKIAPHRTTMRQRIADILKIDPERVSVKATTTERLGFTGRGEGLAAQAVATIRVPA